MKKIPQGRYSKEFRVEAVKLVTEEGLSVPRKHQGSLMCLNRLSATGSGPASWKVGDIGKNRRELSDTELELTRLKREPAMVKMEQDILTRIFHERSYVHALPFWRQKAGRSPSRFCLHSYSRYGHRALYERQDSHGRDFPEFQRRALRPSFLSSRRIIAEKLSKKTNETPMIKPLLDDFDIKGKVVTADALHTQVKTARYIVKEKEADYLFIVKDNQKTLRDDIRILRENDFFPQHQTIDKGHGRLEVRTLRSSTLLNNYLDFPHCGQVFKIVRERTQLTTGTTSTETVYGITSLTPEQADPKRFLLALSREHWSIENRSQYVRDMVYDEDRH